MTNKVPEERLCKMCGKYFVFADTRRVTCSDICSAKWHASKHTRRDRNPIPLEKNCIVCGISFVANMSRQKHCSKECAKKAQLAYLKSYGKNNNKPKENHKNTCALCGDPILLWQKYCTMECQKMDMHDKKEDLGPIGTCTVTPCTEEDLKLMKHKGHMKPIYRYRTRKNEEDFKHQPSLMGVFIYD